MEQELKNCIRMFCQQVGCSVQELNGQADHVHLIVQVPPKISISDLIGNTKRANRDPNVSEIPKSKNSTILGESFLGRRLLC